MNRRLSDIVKQIRILRPVKKPTKRARRIPGIRYPAAIEIAYAGRLIRIFEEMESIIRETVLKHLPGIVSERDRLDDWADDAERLVENAKMGFSTTTANPTGIAAEFAGKTNLWHNTEWRKVMKAAVGVDLYRAEPWLPPVLNSFEKENANLITKMGADKIDRIGRIMQEGLRAGDRSESLAKKILDDVAGDKRRARLIARDQISKLNGQLTMYRQTGLGITRYTWRTMQDERVRATHSENNGKVFEWAKPPARTGHPGHEIRCRCFAEADFSDLLAETQGEG